ncbi:CHAT domain-containing protein [Fischerella thermalis CCMEE 5201]|jgi:CHAT domain-containing protein|nr:CHAT domain-containing protein [Fischerella thermalis CCMEE 5201]
MKLISKVFFCTTLLWNFLSPALAQTTTGQNQKSYSNREILVVGNPKSPNFSPLPGAEKEAVSIAKLFHTQALVGDAATETAVVQRLTQARIIHLATHVLPEAGVIVLAPSAQDDGLLTGEEIQKLHLKADLVVLSGERTALGKITGDGVIGVARSLMAAGATNIIVTLWSVSEQSTTKFMMEFYRQLQKTGDVAGALRQASLKMKRENPNSRDWAAFTLIGSPK